MTAEPILEVDELSVSFPAAGEHRRQRVVDGVSFQVGPAETVGLVGESGSGKTVTALSILGLNDRRAAIDGGRIAFGGLDLLTLRERHKRFRGRDVAMIFQSPKASLHPLLKVGDQIARVVRLHRPGHADASDELALQLMRAVGIKDADKRFRAYPHQLSGGMAQRVMIAIALAAEPELLIADEPTTGLDVTIQAQIFDLLLGLQERLKMSILLITHDLAVVAENCDRIVVMHAGRVVETGSVEAVFKAPKHPYTRRLLGSVLRADRRVRREQLRSPAVGEADAHTATGCRFSSLCECVFEPCREIRPALLPVGPEGHAALCHLYDERFSSEERDA